jgi:thiamine-phosphate diphosphorylase
LSPALARNGSATRLDAAGALGLHFVTDRLRYSMDIDDLVGRAANAARHGADVIQVRERDLPDIILAAVVRRIIGVLDGTSAIVLVNDRVDVALATGAAGVHLRGDSFPASRVRAIAPTGFVIGRSVHSAEDVAAAILDGGADYLMFGTVFPSQGKPPGHRTAGLDVLREICRRSSLPVIAIGGMTSDRVPDIADAGAAGLAAVGWFM